MSTKWAPYRSEQAYVAAVTATFAKLATAPVKHEDRKFHKQMLKDALHIQTASYDPLGRQSRKPLSLEEKFYVYVILDPREPSVWEYVLPGGKVITFKFKPFYIGKGTGSRMYNHLTAAKRLSLNSRKVNTIRKLWRLGLEPIILKLTPDSIEAVAFAKELALIAAIGRHDLKTGPLANHSNGGEGSTGISAVTRKRMSNSALGNPKKPQTEEHVSKRVEAGLATKAEQKASGTYVKYKAPGKSVEMKARWAEDVEYRDKVVTALSQPKTEKHKQNISTALSGKPKSEEHKAAMRNAVRPTIVCPHCDKEGSPSNMYRWHFDNCKFK